MLNTHKWNGNDHGKMKKNKENVLSPKIKWYTTVHVNGTEKNMEKWKRTPPSPQPQKMYSPKIEDRIYGLYVTIQPFGHKMSSSGTNNYYASTFLTGRNTSKDKEDKEAKEEKKIQCFAQSVFFFLLLLC